MVLGCREPRVSALPRELSKQTLTREQEELSSKTMMAAAPSSFSQEEQFPDNTTFPLEKRIFRDRFLGQQGALTCGAFHAN